MEIPIGIFLLKLKVSSTGENFRSNSKSPVQRKFSLKRKVSSTGETFCSKLKCPAQEKFTLRLKVSSTGGRREKLKVFRTGEKREQLKVSSTGEKVEKTRKTQSLQYQCPVKCPVKKKHCFSSPFIALKPL